MSPRLCRLARAKPDPSCLLSDGFRSLSLAPHPRPPQPEIKAGAEHDDGQHIEHRPEDLQRHAAIVAEMQRLRDEQRGHVPGQIEGVGQFAGRGIDQRRLAAGARSAACCRA